MESFVLKDWRVGDGVQCTPEHRQLSHDGNVERQLQSETKKRVANRNRGKYRLGVLKRKWALFSSISIVSHSKWMLACLLQSLHFYLSLASPSKLVLYTRFSLSSKWAWLLSDIFVIMQSVGPRPASVVWNGQAPRMQNLEWGGMCVEWRPPTRFDSVHKVKHCNFVEQKGNSIFFSSTC